MKIGIVGYGVVGKAIEYGFKNSAEILILDPAYKNMSVSMEQMTKEADFIFVGVPTPMNMKDNGKIDTTIIDSVMDLIASFNYNGVVISKSTVIPSHLAYWAKKYSDLRLCMSPEYLIDANPLEAFIEEPMIVVGSNREEDAQSVLDLFKEYSICKATKFFKCDLISSGVLKYMENCYLALKVTFMNQMYDIHQSSGSTDSWDTLSEIFHGDPRMGNSHGKVPGPDGDRGWGGKCVLPDAKAKIQTMIIDEYDQPESYEEEVSIENLSKFIEDKGNGYSNIYSIESCDANLENAEWKEIKVVTERDIDEEIIVFETNSGEFSCTLEHLMPVLRDSKKIIVKAKKIKETDLFFIINDVTMQINKITKRRYKGKVYNLELTSDSEKDDLFWIEQKTGIVTHNCFPKDINAMINYAADELDYDFDLMKKAWEINLRIRKDIDWLKIPGATTNK